MNLPGVDFTRVRVVTLDIGGTLLRPHPGVGAIYAEALARRGRAIAPDLAEARFRQKFAELRARPRAVVNEATERAFWHEVVQASLHPECPEKEMGEVFAELWEEFASARRWRALPGAAEGLAALTGSGRRLAVLSNWDARLRRILDELGWTRHFEKIFISSELGVEKPDARVFRAVEAALGLPSEACLHLGDSYVHDWQGARRRLAGGVARVHAAKSNHPHARPA